MGKIAYRKITFRDPIYDLEATIIYDCDWLTAIETFESMLPREYRISPGIDQYDGYSFKADGGFFIWLRSFKGSVKDYAILVHELEHHVHRILIGTLGMRASLDSTEAFAYYFEYCMREFLTQHRNLLKEKRRKNVQKKKAA